MTQNLKVAVNDAEPLAGHWGNLTPEQMIIFKNVWRRLNKLFEQEAPVKEAEEEPTKAGWFGKKNVDKSTELFLGATSDPKWMSLPLEKAIPLIPGSLLRKTFWNMVNADNPDAIILRYCRARKWEEDAIYNMLINTLRWRIHVRMDDIIALGENGLRDELNRLSDGWGDIFIKQMHHGKVFLGGPDREDRGVCFINVFKHRKEDQPHEVIKILTLFIMESSRIIVHQPVETCCIVFNLENFTLKNMDFDFVKFLVICLEQHFPETLGILLIHKAPWVFSTIWHLITPLLDPVVATKIFFTRNLDELIEKVPEEALPGILTGDPKKITKGEILPDEPIRPGKMGVPDTDKYRDYQAAIRKYEELTAEWLNAKEDPETVVSDRRKAALALRHARYHAELDIRGPTSYSAQDIGRMTADGRCILDFGNPAWVPLDITDTV